MQAGTQRSSWTNKATGTLIEVRLTTVDRIGRMGKEEVFLVEPKYEAELRRWVDYVNRNAKRFLALTIGLSLVAVVGSFLVNAWPDAYWVVSVALVLMGLTFLVYPFSTPETVKMVGMRRARTLGRVGGFVVILMGILVCLPRLL